ncbi:4Fe-4S dicluster domain-containing protein [Candidatus Nitronereus thalassa]|uniref:4Fe-4S dicluster domain-containing protein n=1 Tax=Candidatus Nitronereus thalassa TaxID=3020898 RepID=A0ABU3K8X5_9BACT|nr:4Fe-4S dicluster domain-containing protein [Candidatus Nitronereus thalassa]MDT7042831.1 4Fe-4S dicluster domain-containing protein [Candidatus Nitronereus thalassa]
MGPTVQDGSIQWTYIHQVEDLPIGWRDEQTPGNYRLNKTDSQNIFDIVHGPESLKRQTFAPREQLLQIEKTKKGFSVQENIPQSEQVAILGVRACDLAGLTMQDRIFLQDQFPDPYYQARRQNLFLVAVNCTRAHETCFCASMGTGPKAESGYDLVLTESDQEFLIQGGSPRGEEILESLTVSPAEDLQIQEHDERIAACAASQTRKVNQSSLPQGLYDAHDHRRWDEVATRCLACTNCTMVCPTCFCHTVEETPDLTQHTTEHVRVWDSCFTPDHGYIHGKNFRPTIKDRYRMWLTHKMASWIDQFGSSGCVGCGRCITWCPVGIDVTEELHALLGEKES